jgi:hypothetical protein
MENDIIVKTLKATRNINRERERCVKSLIALRLSFFDRERKSANPSLAESEIRLAAIKERVLLYCSKLSARI